MKVPNPINNEWLTLGTAVPQSRSLPPMAEIQWLAKMRYLHRRNTPHTHAENNTRPKHSRPRKAEDSRDLAVEV